MAFALVVISHLLLLVLIASRKVVYAAKVKIKSKDHERKDVDEDEDKRMTYGGNYWVLR